MNCIIYCKHAVKTTQIPDEGTNRLVNAQIKAWWGDSQPLVTRGRPLAWNIAVPEAFAKVTSAPFSNSGMFTGGYSGRQVRQHMDEICTPDDHSHVLPNSNKNITAIDLRLSDEISPLASGFV